MSETFTMNPNKTEAIQHATSEKLSINQLRAAQDVYDAIRELDTKGVLDSQNPRHASLIGQDLYAWQRGLCLPTATATAINSLKGRRVITEEKEGQLTIGDYYRLLLPHDGRHASQTQPRGWFVVNNSAELYHHAAVAIAQSCGITAFPCENFTSIRQFTPAIQEGGVVAVSLNNRFVGECTLASADTCRRNGQGQFEILVPTSNGREFRVMNPGNHVVTILSVSNDQAIVADSFNLGDTPHGLIIEVPITDLDKYLAYSNPKLTTKGIIFTQKESMLPTTHLPIKEPVIPAEVLQDLANKVRI